MSWRAGTIGDLVALQRGHDLTEANREPGDVPVVGAAGPNGYHSQPRAAGPGAVIGRSGGSIGKVTYVPCDFWPHNTCLYVTDFKGNHPRFVAYLLSTLNLAQLNSGAAQPSLNRNFVYPVRVRFPNPREQERIVSILSAYDDLIENNRRRIQLLEQAARLLYKEWFVHFRFPGDEHVKIADGVPEGWVRKYLEDVAEITMGQSPKSQYYNEDGIGLPFHQGVTKYGIRFPTNKIYCTIESRIAESGDILFSVRAPVGRINITLDKIVIGRGLAAIKSNCEQQNSLFYQLKNYFHKEDMMGGGAIFAAITKKDLHRLELLMPRRQHVEMFQEHVTPIDRQIETLHKTI